MKIDELTALAAGMTEDVLIKLEDVTLDIKNKGDLKNTFPILNCAKCMNKCCPSGMGLSLFDIARFIDEGLDNFITGTFEGYAEFVLSGGNHTELPIPRIVPAPSGKPVCVFLDEAGRCRIYRMKPISCRIFPLIFHKDEDGSCSVSWSESCQSYEISSDEAVFRKFLSNAVRDYNRNYNERFKDLILLMHAKEQLKSLGFGKYLGDD